MSRIVCTATTSRVRVHCGRNISVYVTYADAFLDRLVYNAHYRAMAWLGEEIAPATAGALAPRCTKDMTEERLFGAIAEFW